MKTTLLLLLAAPAVRADTSSSPSVATYACVGFQDRGGRSYSVAFIRLATGEKLWTRPMGTSGWCIQQSGPLVLVANVASGMEVIERSTGRTAWKEEMPALATCSLEKDRIYAATKTELQCWSLASGKRTWTQTLGAQMWKAQSVAGRLCVACNDGGLRCLNLQTGEPLWRTVGTGAWRSMFIEGDRVYSATGAGSELDCIDVKDGSKKWSTNVGHTVGWGFISGGRVIVFDYGRKMTCLSAETGATLWTFSGAGNAIPLKAEGSGAIIVRLGKERQMVGLDASTGKRLWTTGIPSEEAYPLVLKRQILVADQDGRTIAAHDPATGAKSWTFKSSANNPWPSVKDMMVCTLKSEREVVRLDLATGVQSWKYEASDRVVMTHILDTRVLVGTASSIACVSAASGRKMWEWSLETPADYQWVVFAE